MNHPNTKTITTPRLHNHLVGSALLCLCSLAAACVPALETEDSSADGSLNPGEDGDIESQPSPDGTSTQVDATSETIWIYFDIDLDLQVSADDPGWDLAFSRANIKLNGGASGAADVAIVKLDGEPYDTLLVLPKDGWKTDAPDGDDEDVETDYAMADWYEYDVVTHLLSPADRVYGLRSSDGHPYKVQLRDYYDEFGTSAYVRFVWDSVD